MQFTCLLIPEDVFGLFKRLGCPGGGEGVSRGPPEGEKISFSLPSLLAVDLLLDLLSHNASSELEVRDVLLLERCLWCMSGRLVISTQILALHFHFRRQDDRVKKPSPWR